MPLNTLKNAPVFFIDDMISNDNLTARLYAKPGSGVLGKDAELLGISPLAKDALNFSYSHEFVKAGDYSIMDKMSRYARDAAKYMTMSGQVVDSALSSINSLTNNVDESKKDSVGSVVSTLTELLHDNEWATKLTTNRFVSATENSYMYDGTTVTPPITDLNLIYVSGMKYGNTVCNVKDCISKFLYYTIGKYRGASEFINAENKQDFFGFIESPNGFQWSKTGISSLKEGESDTGTFYINYGGYDGQKTINDLLVRDVNIRVSPYRVKVTNDYYYAIITVSLVLNKLRTRDDLTSWMGLSQYNPDQFNFNAKSNKTEIDDSWQKSQLAPTQGIDFNIKTI